MPIRHPRCTAQRGYLYYIMKTCPCVRVSVRVSVRPRSGLSALAFMASQRSVLASQRSSARRSPTAVRSQIAVRRSSDFPISDFPISDFLISDFLYIIPIGVSVRLSAFWPLSARVSGLSALLSEKLTRSGRSPTAVRSQIADRRSSIVRPIADRQSPTAVRSSIVDRTDRTDRNDR